MICHCPILLLSRHPSSRLPFSIPPSLSPCAPSLGPSPALALATCLDLENFLLCLFLYWFVWGYFVHGGKGFLWYSKGSDWAQSHEQLLFDVDNFIPIQFPAFSNSCRSLNSKHLSQFSLSLLKVHRHFYKKSLTTYPVPHRTEVTSLVGPWVHPEKVKPLN